MTVTHLSTVLFFSIPIYIRRTVYLTFHEDSRTTAMERQSFHTVVCTVAMYIYFFQLSVCTILCTYFLQLTVCTARYMHQNVFVVPLTLRISIHTTMYVWQTLWTMSVTAIDGGNYQNDIGLQEGKWETRLWLAEGKKNCSACCTAHTGLYSR
jgi:hypothetical protein